MHGLREWLVRLGAAPHGRRPDDDIAEELRLHVDLAEEDALRRGDDPATARRLARLQAGGAAQAMEAVRDQRGLPWLDSLRRDVAYGWRALWRAPAFTAMLLLTLALGIGATTAIFSAVYGVLLRPLPYPDPDRLVMIWDGSGGERTEVTFGTYRELMQRSRTLGAMAAMRPVQVNLTSVAEPERLEGQYVSADYFRVLGVRPALGRDFSAADDQRFQPTAPFVAIISDSLWRRRFSADPSVVGRQFRVNDIPVTLIGIMPPTFENVLSPSAEIWSTLMYDPALPLQGREWGRHLRLIGRLEPGSTHEAARDELAAIARTADAAFKRPPQASLADGVIAGPMRDELTLAAKPVLVIVLGAALLLLAIACVNVTNLLLARGAERRAELAVRRALGASQGRIIGQLMTETLLVATLGGALGIGLAYEAVGALVALSPPDLPRIDAIGVDRTVLAASIALTLLVGLTVGVLPALQSTRRHLYRGMQLRARIVPDHFTRRVLVVVQVALAVVLLAGAGLLIRSLDLLMAVPPGFDPRHLLTMQIQTGGRQFRDPTTTHRYFSEVLQAVRRVAGVTTAALSSQLPLSGEEDVWGLSFDKVPPVAAQENPEVYRYAVSPGYFETMRIALRKGRLLTSQDDARGMRVAVINEAMARRRLPGVDPIGRQLTVGPATDPPFTVVGVVGDVKQTALDVARSDAVYMPADQWTRFADPARWLVVRGDGDAAALTSAVRRAVQSVDTKQPVVRVAIMEDRLNRTAADRIFARLLFGMFGAVALVLAAIGTYSLLSGGVAERSREIGIRAALGASRKGILGLILRQGLALTAAGLVVGLAGALAGSGALSNLLYQVQPGDPVTLLAVSGAIAAVALLACWLPAWRASRLDPSVVLRSD